MNLVIDSNGAIRNRIATSATGNLDSNVISATMNHDDVTTVDGPTTSVIIQNWTLSTPTVVHIIANSGVVVGLEATTSASNGSLGVGGGIPWMTSRPPVVVAPDWITLRTELKWTWMLHTYGFACFFFMLAFYSFFSILNLRAQLSARPYMSSINVFLCLLGISRALCFLIDPYNSKGTLPEAIGSILWALAFPCLISAFGLIQLAFLQLTQLRLGPSKLRSKSCMSLVVTTHFCLTIALNIIWSLQKDFKSFSYVSQTVFIGWGTFLCATFLYGGWKMMQMLHHAPASLFQRSDSSGFENKVLALGLLANCHNLAAMTAAAAATVPSFLATPKIRITDENEQTYSYVSDNSHVSSSQNLQAADAPDGEGGNGSNCRMSPLRIPGGSRGGGGVGGSGVYTVSEDGPNSSTDGITEHTLMLSEDDTVCTSHPRSKPAKKNNQKGSIRLLSSMRTSSALNATNDVPLSQPNVINMDHNKSNQSKDREDNLEMSLLPRSMGINVGGNGLLGDKMGAKQDLTLMSILNHIAYVNNAAEECKFDIRKLKTSRKGQIERVLQGTYASAALGFLLCMMETYRIYGPYGVSAGLQPPAPWPWFAFQTIYRFTEFVMGCFMANITKQPVTRHHYPYSCYMKHQGGE